MSKFLYFAYGSNVLEARLKNRCPSATPVGLAISRDHALEFSKKSIDGSGKATLTRKAGSIFYGRLFEIDISERANLDRAEGKGSGYDVPDVFEVQRAGASENLCVTTYIASQTDGALSPYDWYLALVISGYIEAGVSEEQIMDVALREYVIDSDTKRGSRKDAESLIGKSPYAVLDDTRKRYQGRG